MKPEMSPKSPRQITKRRANFLRSVLSRQPVPRQKTKTRKRPEKDLKKTRKGRAKTCPTAPLTRANSRRTPDELRTNSRRTGPRANFPWVATLCRRNCIFVAFFQFCRPRCRKCTKSALDALDGSQTPVKAPLGFIPGLYTMR